MTKREIDLIRTAIEQLQRLVPDVDPKSRQCPLAGYLESQFLRDPETDYSCAELWRWYEGDMNRGTADKMSQAEFFRRLPGALATVFGIRKSHGIMRAGRRVRGFKGIAARDTLPPCPANWEPAIEPDSWPDIDLDPRPTTVDPTVPVVIEDIWAVKL